MIKLLPLSLKLIRRWTSRHLASVRGLLIWQGPGATKHIDFEGRLSPEAGLTVLELMIVLVILSLIGVVASVQVLGQLDRAKVDIAKLQLHQLENALSLFQLDTRRFPATDEGLAVLFAATDKTEGWRGPYIKAADLQKDPWGTLVGYELTDPQHFRLTSLGADRATGGDGANADFSIAGGY